jgi:hypothetical protein
MAFGFMVGKWRIFEAITIVKMDGRWEFKDKANCKIIVE